jgi:phage tail sheath gpL-like
MTNTSKLFRTLAVAGLGVALTATQSGCLIAAAAAGTGAAVAYVKGDTEAVVEHTPQQVTDAAKAVAADMKLAVVTAEATGFDGKMLARTADDTKVDVTVKSVGETSSKVMVRVGTFGDEAMQNAILAKIKAKLDGEKAVAKAE